MTSAVSVANLPRRRWTQPASGRRRLLPHQSLRHAQGSRRSRGAPPAAGGTLRPVKGYRWCHSFGTFFDGRRELHLELAPIRREPTHSSMVANSACGRSYTAEDFSDLFVGIPVVVTQANHDLIRYREFSDEPTQRGCCLALRNLDLIRSWQVLQLGIRVGPRIATFAAEVCKRMSDERAKPRAETGTIGVVFLDLSDAGLDCASTAASQSATLKIVAIPHRIAEQRRTQHGHKRGACPGLPAFSAETSSLRSIAIPTYERYSGRSRASTRDTGRRLGIAPTSKSADDARSSFHTV